MISISLHKNLLNSRFELWNLCRRTHAPRERRLVGSLCTQWRTMPGRNLWRSIPKDCMQSKPNYTQLNQFKSLKTIHCALFSSHVHAHWPIVEISLPEPVTWVQTVMRCATVIAATPDAVVRNVPKDLLVIHWLPVVRVSLIEHQMPIVIHAEHCANTRTAVANVKSIRLAPVVIAAKSNHSSWVQNGARDASNASVWAWAKIVRAAHCIATKSEPHLCPTTMISVWLLTTKVHKSLTSKLRPTAKRCRSRE